MKKRIFYTEAAYFLGIALLALGTALMERGGFGISIVVAPAYVLHLATSLSFGVAEYILQGAILLLTVVLLRRARLRFFLSFVTALLYGAVLDGCMALVMPVSALAAQLGCYIAGALLCALSIALMFHTYLPTAVYELFVKEVSNRFSVELYRFKTGYDLASCLLAAAMSLLVFAELRGVGVGSVVCALCNGVIIRRISAFLEKHWEFRNGLPQVYSFFEKET